jgi:hypothetical protein
MMQEFYLARLAVGGVEVMEPDGPAREERARRAKSGLVIDFDGTGRPIGIEITDPSGITIEDLNGVLADLSLAPLTGADLAPLRVA